jgi:hypothetical protein
MLFRAGEQMLGKTVMINTPSYFRAIFRAVSVFMPKSALEKVRRSRQRSGGPTRGDGDAPTKGQAV